MSELQDILRVQARLHRKQGANALGDLFDNASKEIESLSEQLAKANEEIEFISDLSKMRKSEIKSLSSELVKAKQRLADREEFVNELQVKQACRDRELERIDKELAKANERVKELDKTVLEEIENRDNREEWLDGLSAEVGRFFGVDIGEHSSANNPWREAIEAIPNSTLNKFAIENQIKALNWFPEKYCDDEHSFLADKAIEQLRKEQSNANI